MGNKKKEKKGFLGKIIQYFKEVRSELRKVTWPNRKELTQYTTVVFVSVFVMAFIIWIVDSAFTGLLNLILK